MIGIIAALVVVGCGGKKVEVEVAEAMAVATPEQACTECERLKIMSFPIVDGPTEFRHDNAIVGVGWGDGSTEWVYMFTNSMAFLGGWESNASIAQYSNKLVPYKSGAGSPLGYHEVGTYRRFTPQGNSTSCELDACYLDRKAFESGFPTDLKNRVNPDGQPPEYNRAQGFRTERKPFGYQACIDSAGGANGAHVDELHQQSGEQWEPVGWQYSWLSGQNTMVYSVFQKGVQFANGLRQADSVLPDDVQDDGSSFDDWCQHVASQCFPTQNKKACTARLVTWTYPGED